jgi:hypothetical protein
MQNATPYASRAWQVRVSTRACRVRGQCQERVRSEVRPGRVSGQGSVPEACPGQGQYPGACQVRSVSAGGVSGKVEYRACPGKKLSTRGMCSEIQYQACQVKVSTRERIRSKLITRNVSVQVQYQGIIKPRGEYQSVSGQESSTKSVSSPRSQYRACPGQSRITDVAVKGVEYQERNGQSRVPATRRCGTENCVS